MEILKVVNARQIVLKRQNQPLKFSTAYKFRKFINETEDAEKFFNEKRDEIIKKYAEKNDSGEIKVDESGNVNFRKEDIENVNKEYSELVKTDISVCIKFKPEELESLDLTIAEVDTLSDLIEE